MRAPKAKTEIRREQIAQAALRLLAVRGWGRVSLATIARELGMVPSALYRHYPSKDAVLDAVLDLVGQHFQTNVQKAGPATGDPLCRLREVLRRHAELISSGVPVPRIILSEDVFTGRARHRRRVEAIYADYLGAIAQIIRQGQELGLIRRDCSPELLSKMWLGLVQSPAILWLISDAGFDLRQHCESAWRLFAAALRPPRRAARK